MMIVWRIRGKIVRTVYEQFLKMTVVGLELGLVLVFVFFAQV